jgi:hypothetical protein
MANLKLSKADWHTIYTVLPDKTRRKIGRMERRLAALSWQRITPESLPKVGEEVGNWETYSDTKNPTWYSRPVDEDGCEQIGDDFIRIADMTVEDWHELGLTYHRSINAPQEDKPHD